MTERATGLRARERLSTSENEFGPAPDVVRAIGAAARECHRYPDCDHHELRRRLGHARRPRGPRAHRLRHRRTARRDRPRLPRAGRTAVTSDATYPTFAYFARARGATVHLVPYRNTCVDTEELIRRAHGTGADVVYLADPDNPTGGSLGAPALLDLAGRLPERTPAGGRRCLHRIPAARRPDRGRRADRPAHALAAHLLQGPRPGRAADRLRGRRAGTARRTAPRRRTLRRRPGRRGGGARRARRHRPSRRHRPAHRRGQGRTTAGGSPSWATPCWTGRRTSSPSGAPTPRPPEPSPNGSRSQGCSCAIWPHPA
ncbi:aminotransferase class I/II-fold pyridoxal phosphate-dependent enzyme [Streptomyces tricolor]|nr:aminotransferase class I/II-fold pyridoxal phosphate-dependent enzyme [Streptomyces tricolor]